MAIPGSIQKLRQQQNVAQKEVERLVLQSRARLAPKIRKAGSSKNIRRQTFRNSFYEDVPSHYEVLGRELDRWGRELTDKTAVDWHKRAIHETRRQGAKVKPSVVKYNRERTERYFRLVHPDTTQHLAAVFTDKMTESDIGALRSSTQEVFRRQSLEGLTANQTQKELQSTWDGIAGNMDAFRFVDARGRQWSNRDYFRMLTRTIGARVSRDSYMDTIVANGDDLVRIVPSGESCKICDAWIGIIISISGSDPRFPSYQQSLDLGMWHPNCDCFIRRMDATIHKNNIERQASQPNVNFNAAQDANFDKQEFADEVARYKTGFLAASPAPTAKSTLDAVKERPRIATKANQVVAQATTAEPETSAQMQTIAAANDAKMEGLRHAVKGADSTTRKIAGERADNPDWTLATIEKQNVHDALRYTMILDDDKYTDGVVNITNHLRDLDYKQVITPDGRTKWRNGWNEPHYGGINTVWRKPGGQKVELQFHTPRGLFVKDEFSHPIYEKIRLVNANVPAERAAAQKWKADIIDHWSTVPTPAGADRLTQKGTLPAPKKPKRRR